MVLPLVIAFVLLNVRALFAQITITADDLLGLIGPLERTVEIDNSNGPKVVDLGLPGTNQRWDFTSITLDSSLIFNYTVVEPTGTPFAAGFPDANLTDKYAGTIEVSGQVVPFEIYTYFSVQPDAFRILGNGLAAYLVTGTPTSLSVSVRGNAIPAPLPLDLGDTWSGVESDTITDAVTMTKTIENRTSSFVVDASGIITVGSSELEALRVCSFDTTIVMLFDNNQEILQGPDTLTTITYNFATKDNGFVARITSFPGETNLNFNEAFGVIRVTGGVSTAVQNPNVGPKAVALGQNFPNPFTDHTAITYSIHQGQNIELSIYDLWGNEIHTLADGHYPPGQYSVIWDAGSFHQQALPQGIYHVRLRSENGIQSLKMIYINP